MPHNFTHMKKISKKEIELTVSNSLIAVVTDFNITEPSKKTNKLIKKVSRKMSEELKQDLKKQMKQMEKVSRKSVNGKAATKALSA